MIDIAKRTSQAANASASDTMSKLKDIQAEIDALKALNASGSPDQANIDRMLNDVDVAGECRLLCVMLCSSATVGVCGDASDPARSEKPE